MRPRPLPSSQAKVIRMKYQNFRATALVLACTGMLLQPIAMAAPQTSPITDIALQSGGLLVGQITSDHGQPIADVPVSIIQRGQEIARVATDRQGTFSIPDLQGGVYQVATVGQQGIYRLWAPHTAPPVARQNVKMVTGQVVRGQGEVDKFSQFAGWVKGHPLITGGVIAAAIIIPLAVSNSNSDDDNGPSS